MLKLCTKCGISKEVSDFYSNPKRQSWCISCCRENVRNWQNRNRQKIQDYNKERYELDLNHRESERSRSKDNYRSNRDTPSYKSKKASREAYRRSYKLQATPVWLTRDHLEEIKYFYWLCSDLKITTGQNYEVDHIVPLKGKNVCGLHVPWNLQILPDQLNRIKHNSYII